ncbi:MNIO family bufferin maturase [Zobellella sp. An-6]|uniref:MNIO family bufferin maturase n=1 Tax=Zobellella sp. An-6 TaxID=3400218 RepID=UPI0040414387
MTPTSPRGRDAGASRLPAGVGLGLKLQHADTILAERPPLAFFEVHAENYMVAGGPRHHYLERIRARYPLSIHGVGMSIGGEEALDREHLARLARLVARYQPEAVSEHLAWTGHGGHFANDLLPLAYTPASLQRVCDHIGQIQDCLRRPILLENPATYLTLADSSLEEADFINQAVRISGCGLLLDLNNVYVSAVNHGHDALAYIAALPLERVGELHLAGFDEQWDDAGARLLIDSHGAPIAEPVWALYRRLLARTGPLPTLIERDNQIPAFAELLVEARRAEALLTAPMES